MKKNRAIYVLALFVLAAGAGLLSGQSVDLSGTWVGETEVPDAIEPDGMTLVIAKVDGAYSAKISDTMGMLENTPCEDFDFAENKLKFRIQVNTGSEYMAVYITLTVEGNTMTGYWESEGGDTGPIKLEKK